MMEISNLVRKLKEAGIGVSLQGEDLEVSIYNDDVDMALIEELRASKAGVRQFFLNNKQEEFLTIHPQEDTPISYAQRRLLILSQFKEASVSYNIPFAIRLEGYYDILCFQKAILAVIHRHEILRTVFRENEEGVPYQHIYDHCHPDFAVQYFDWRQEPHNEEKVKKYCTENAQEVFDLENGPLLRVVLFQIKDDCCVFYYNIHHIISDGWSKEVMSKEVFTLYHAFLNNQQPELPVLNIQYKDYAAWQRNLISSGALNASRNYWLQQLAGDIPVLDLPADVKRPLLKTYNGRKLSTHIDAALTTRLRAFSLQQGGSLFMGLLSVLKILFYRYTSQSDIIIGSPVAAREHRDLQHQIGFYVNTLPLRDHILPTDTLTTAFEKVKENCLHAFRHQMYPFDLLMDELDIKRDTGRSLLFDVMLILQHGIGDGHDIQTTDEILDGGSISSKFDLLFNFTEVGNHLSFIIEYNSDVYGQAIVTQFIRHFRQILDALLTHPGREIGQLNFLAAGEVRQLLETFNDTELPFDKQLTILDYLHQQVADRPEATALLFQDTRFTYAQLNERAGQLAGYLQTTFGLAPGRLAGLLLTRNANMLVAMLAVLKTGAAYVPMDPSYPMHRLRYIIDDAAISLLISDEDNLETSNKLQWECKGLSAFVSLDTRDVHAYAESSDDYNQSRQLWDYVGETAADDIASGGWMSSYTGQSFSSEEMQEYTDNILNNLRPYLDKGLKVLEIGCSSGLTLRAIAPYVGRYVGVDISPAILGRLKNALAEEGGFEHVTLQHLSAFEINKVNEADFDIIIMNSVVQYFGKYNYFRNVLQKTLDLLKADGLLYIGDVMDLALKNTLIDDLKQFKYASYGKGYTTKTDFSTELFLSREFFYDLPHDYATIEKVTILDKQFTIVNELSAFRYDVILKKGVLQVKEGTRRRQQYGFSWDVDCDFMAPVLHPHDPAYVIYTSGSTGHPKGVVVSHASLAAFVQNYSNKFYLKAPMVIGAVTNITFDISVLELIGSLGCGLTIHLLDMDDPDTIYKNLQHKRINALQITPSRLAQLTADTGMAVLESLDVLLIGGEALGEVQFQELKQLSGTVVINVYGPTETTIWSSCLYVKEAGMLSVGKPLYNEALYILDDHLKLVPMGVTGEICISGSGLALGYLNLPELTAEKFVPHPFRPGEKLYRTGDLGRHLADGAIAFMGRKDDQVKVRGYRIELGEIAHAVNSYETITQAVILAIENKNREKELVAYFTASETVQLGALISYLRDLLPVYMLPTHFVQLPAMPLNASGKVNRKVLPDPTGLTLAGTQAYEAPQNELEKAVANLWAQELGRESIGRKANFFELGGHSLKATRLISSYQRLFGVRLSLKDLFVYVTVKEHAALIAAAEQHSYAGIERVPAAAGYDLSDAQRRLWVLSHFEEMETAYNLPGHVKLKGHYNMERLKKAISAVVQRHEILRTVFREDENGVLKQWILDAIDINFKDIDLRHHSHREVFAATYIADDNNVPFDLVNGPLLRGCIMQLEDDEYLFYYNMHHIISDGWSAVILAKEVQAFYEDLDAQLPQLPVQYRDYAAWQLKQLDTNAWQYQQQYWLQQLSGELPTLELCPREHAENTGDGYAIGSLFPKALTEKLRSFCFNRGGTLFMGLVAAFKALCYRYTDLNDFIIGTPVAGRPHAELENQIGFYVNTLVLRTQIDSEDSFTTLFDKVKSMLLDAYVHQMYPFNRLVDELGVKRDTNKNPIFDILFALQNTGEISAAEVLADYGACKAKFGLDISFREVSEGLSLKLIYNRSLYSHDFMRRFVRHYQQLLVAMLTTPDIQLGTVNYMDSTERNELLPVVEQGDVNDTIVARFYAQVHKTPHHPALVYRGRRLSYQELDQLSNQLARYLQARYTILPNTRIAVRKERSDSLIVSLLAILKTGAAYVPIDPAYPAERVRYMLEDIVIDDALYNEFLDHKEEYDTTAPDVEITPDDLVYVIYTSGSTGRPKGIMMPHRVIANLMHFHEQTLFAENVLQFASVSFDVSFQEIFSTLLQGATLHILEEDSKRDIVALQAFILENQIDMVFFPTAFFKVVMEMEDFITAIAQVVKHIIVAGEQLVLGPVFRRQAAGITLHNHYGPAETHVVTTYSMADFPGTAEIPPIGKPIANTSIYILDRFGQLVPRGISGEIYIGGACVAKGYLHQPELSVARFLPDPFQPGERMYRTGDIGRWLPDGNLAYTGRKDDQVKIRGYRVEPGEIETVLLTVENITAAVVTVYGKELVAYYTSSAPVPDLKVLLLQRLPDYMVPRYFMQLASLPLTVNGKVDKRALPAPSGALQGTSYTSPRTAEERALLALWKEILQLDRIGIDDNFFEIGGHSLTGIKLIFTIREKLNLPGFRLSHLYLYPTIRSMALTLPLEDTVILQPQEGMVKTGPATASRTVMLLPGAGGILDEYAPLIQQLQQENQVIGVDYTQLLSRHVGIDSLPALAALLGSQLKNYSIQGELEIVGHSFGAIVGFELAKILEKEESPVKELVMLDMPPTFQQNKGLLPMQAPGILENETAPELEDYFRASAIITGWINEYEVNGTISTPVKVLCATDSFFDGESYKDWKRYTRTLSLVPLAADHRSIVHSYRRLIKENTNQS